jgi:hypothetical protein
MPNIIIPSSKADREKIKIGIIEMTNCMTRMDAEKEAKKEICDELSSTFGLPKSAISKLATTLHKRNFGEVKTEHEDFEALYTILLESGNTSE